MIFFDSPEAEKLKKLISDKKLYLSKLDSNKFAFQQTQKEIIFLSEILPIVLSKSNLVHSEIAKYSVKAFETALQYHCNDVLIAFHIDDNYSDKPIVGIAYPKLLEQFGKPGAMNLIIDNMDGNGAKVSPFNLPLNELM